MPRQPFPTESSSVRLNEELLDGLYERVRAVDGNDESGIVVGIMTTTGFEIEFVRSLVMSSIRVCSRPTLLLIKNAVLMLFVIWITSRPPEVERIPPYTGTPLELWRPTGIQHRDV